MEKRANSHLQSAVKLKFLPDCKRSQATAFIIIAIIITAVIIGFFLIQKTKTQTNLEKTFSKLGITTEASAVQLSILDCVKDMSESALTIIGIQGGYYNKPEKNFNLGWAFIPYYYHEGEFLQPSTEKIEQELGDYVDDNLKFCISQLPYEDFSINYKSSKTTAEIKPNEVSFQTDAILTIKKGDLSSEFELKKHPVSVESALSDILELATYITDSHREDPKMICISCVADMAEIKNLYVDMLDFGDETTTLVVISENYTSSEPYIYEFLNKYPE